MDLELNVPIKLNIVMVIVGNKIDKTEQEEVPYTQGKDFADKYNALFKITSAKDGKGIYVSVYI